MQTVRRTIVLVMVLAVTACAVPGLRDDAVRPLPTYAKAPAETGLLSEVADQVANRHGPNTSGFHLLSASRDALLWRLALIDSAQSSLDILTYLWYPDFSGRLLLERAVEAARKSDLPAVVLESIDAAKALEAPASRSSRPSSSTRPTPSIPEDTLDDVLTVPGVRVAEGGVERTTLRVLLRDFRTAALDEQRALIEKLAGDSMRYMQKCLEQIG